MVLMLLRGMQTAKNGGHPIISLPSLPFTPTLSNILNALGDPGYEAKLTSCRQAGKPKMGSLVEFPFITKAAVLGSRFSIVAIHTKRLPISSIPK